MSQETNSFIFIDGIRNSKQVLHRNYLYNKHSGVKYRCSECRAMISIDESTLTVSKGPTKHQGHDALSTCRVSVMKAIKRMKERAIIDTTVSIKEIYEQELLVLTSLGIKISDVNSPLVGGLLPFSRFRGTLARIRKSIMPKLPQTQNDIDFDLEIHQKYKLTNEGALSVTCVNNLTF